MFKGDLNIYDVISGEEFQKKGGEVLKNKKFDQKSIEMFCEYNCLSIKNCVAN